MAIWDATVKFSGSLWSGKTVPSIISESVSETAAFLKRELPKVTPVKTGRMKNSWAVGHTRRFIMVTNTAKNKRGTIYAGFVEDGTRKMKARRPLGQTLPKAEEFFINQVLLKSAQKLAAASSASARSRQENFAEQIRKSKGFRNIKRQRPIKLT